ncbi:hypothetical protein LCGC14_1385210, partial [marine sediment metagenome]
MVSDRSGNELFDAIAQIEGIDEIVDGIRQKRTLDPEGPQVSESLSLPDQVDLILKEGTDEQRRAVTLQLQAPPPGSFPHEPRDLYEAVASHFGQDLPFVDSRLAELSAEIPSIDQTDGFLASTWGRATDIGGNIIGSTLSALAVPADMTERAVGMFWWNELSMDERWSVGTLTYDSIWDDWFGNGQAGKSAILRDRFLGASIEELEDRYTNVWADGIAKFMLDPLWLIGGVPFVTKIPGIGGTALVGAVGRGAPLGKLPGLNRFRLTRTLGVSKEDAILAQSYEELIGTGSEKALDAAARSHNGKFRQAWHLTPRAMADDDMGVFKSVYGTFQDPALWADDGARVRQFTQDLRRGNRTSGLFSERVFEGSTPINRLRAILAADKELGPEMANFRSVQPIQLPGGTAANARRAVGEDLLERVRQGKGSEADRQAFASYTSSEFWRGADEALTFNGESLLSKLEAGRRLTDEEAAFYGRYRAARLLDEIHSRVMPRLNNLHGVDELDFFSRAERLSAAIKYPLSLVILNTPRFVVLNHVSNAFHLSVKTNNLRSGLRYATGHGYGRIGGYERGLMDQAGLSDDLLDKLSTEGTFGELIGITGRDRAWWKTGMSLPLVVAQRLDRSHRAMGYVEFANRAGDSAWRTGEGIIPSIPDELSTIPGFESWITGRISLRDLDNLLANDLNPDNLITGQSFVQDWAKHQWAATNKGAQAARGNTHQLLASQIPPEMLDDIDDLIQSTAIARREGSTVYMADALERLDDMADQLDLRTFNMRNSDNLAEVPLPMTSIRGRLAPWQDIAHGTRQRQRVNSLAQR